MKNVQHKTNDIVPQKQVGNLLQSENGYHRDHPVPRVLKLFVLHIFLEFRRYKFFQLFNYLVFILKSFKYSIELVLTRFLTVLRRTWLFVTCPWFSNLHSIIVLRHLTAHFQVVFVGYLVHEPQDFLVRHLVELNRPLIKVHFFFFKDLNLATRSQNFVDFYLLFASRWFFNNSLSNWLRGEITNSSYCVERTYFGIWTPWLSFR